jgi:hypothetical protein
LYGQLITDENCPTVAGSWALADAATSNCATANQCNATNRTFRRSQKREQDFGRPRATDSQLITKNQINNLYGGCQHFFHKFYSRAHVQRSESNRKMATPECIQRRNPEAITSNRKTRASSTDLVARMCNIYYVVGVRGTGNVRIGRIASNVVSTKPNSNL